MASQPNDGAAGSPSGSPSGAQSLDEDYMREVNDIREGTLRKERGSVDIDPHDADVDDGTDDELSKTPDEGEQELAWLKDAGYGHLVSKFEEGKELEEKVVIKETSSLTRAQAAAVKKRVDTLNATIRKKQKHGHKTDVRDVFVQPDADAGSSEGGGKSILRDKTSKTWDGSRMKNRNSYSMTGDQSVHESSTAAKSTPQPSSSVQMISIQSKGTRQPSSPGGALQTLPDGEVNHNFVLDYNSNGTQDDSRSTSADGSSDGLPNFHLVQDILGITHVAGLGKTDLDKLRALALIELTALFDTSGITYVRRKPKRRMKDHGIFGVPLQTLLEHDQKKNPSQNIRVPIFFKQLIDYLDKYGIIEMGILRVPGSASRIKQLRQIINEKFPEDKFQWDDVRPNDAAGLLKQFIRELPQPLLTMEHFDAFAQVEAIADRSDQVRALNLLVLLLPDVHRDTLQLLLSFLLKVVMHEANLMNLNNVAMIMAPNLFLIQSKKSKNIKEIEIRMAAGTATVIKMLIKYQQILWTVPSFMITQIRHQYETEMQRKSRDKSIMKFLVRKDKNDVCKKPVIQCERDYRQGIIKVQAPHLNQLPTPIQLDQQMQATDILEQFRRRTLESPPSGQSGKKKNKVTNGSSRRSTSIRRGIFRSSRKGSTDALDTDNKRSLQETADSLVLYEVGGNIGERQLDNSANMLELLRANPNAAWVIRIKPD